MRKILIIFIVIDLFWSLNALIFDWPVILKISPLLWPFLIICPIFPFLLAIGWYQIYKTHKINDYILSFAALPSLIYLLGALIYYPLWMANNGFDFWALGGIFWVAFYGLQGGYLLFTYRPGIAPLLFAGFFLIISFIIQFQTKTAT